MSDLTEPVEEPRVPQPVPESEPVDPEAEVARRNVAFGWALFALFLLLFAGTWLVAFIYLALD